MIIFLLPRYASNNLVFGTVNAYCKSTNGFKKLTLRCCYERTTLNVVLFLQSSRRRVRLWKVLFCGFKTTRKLYCTETLRQTSSNAHDINNRCVGWIDLTALGPDSARKSQTTARYAKKRKVCHLCPRRQCKNHQVRTEVKGEAYKSSVWIDLSPEKLQKNSCLTSSNWTLFRMAKIMRCLCRCSRRTSNIPGRDAHIQDGNKICKGQRGNDDFYILIMKKLEVRI